MTTPQACRQSGINFLKWVRSTSNLMLSDFPADKATYQPSPTDNHVIWVLGHLASTDVWVASELNIPGITVPESFKELFGGGTSPSPDALKYPPYVELKLLFDSTHDKLVKWYESAPESAMQIDLTQKSGGFTSDPIDMLFKLGWHEGWHFGQVASVRKALNLPRKMG